MKRFLSLVVIGILVFSVTGAFPAVAEEEYDQLVLIRDVGETEDISDLEEAGDVLDRYGRYVLLETSESAVGEIENAYNIDELEHRNRLNIKGHEFETNEGYPDFDPDLMIDEYEPGTEGLYIVDMIGPVNPEWRQELEELGVEVINYQRNYAYEVKMTPELVEDVEDLFFVDWIGIYQPGFKLAEDIETGEINIRLVENASDETFDRLESLIEVYSTTELATYGMQVIAEVENEFIFSKLTGMREVYYIANHLSGIEFDSEIATQITGGGAWIWDPDEDPNVPYRGHGEYGSLANQLGYTGKRVTIAVFDSGFWEDELDDIPEDRIVGGAQYVDGEWIQDQWGSGDHGTHVAGIAAGNTHEGTGRTVNEWLTEDADPPVDDPEIGDYYAAQGAAPDAELYLQDYGTMEDFDYYSPPRNAVENSEAYIHTNSWSISSNSTYLLPSEAYDMAVRDSNIDTSNNEPMVILSSAGNYGYGVDDQGYKTILYTTIGSPGTGKNEITVGATETYNPDLIEGNPYAGQGHVFEPFSSDPDRIFKSDPSYEDGLTGSSRGWTVDERIKPDVVAPGKGVLSTDYNDEYQIKSGTSMSTPNVAGQAAVVIDWYEEQFGEKPSPAMVKAMLINTAEPLESDQADDDDIPNKHEGWGMVNLGELVHPDALNFILEDQNALVETGELHEYAVTYEDDSEPMKVSLVWTDKEASVGDDPILKNDVNLEVEDPNGDTYYGNAFEEGWTQSNTDVPEEWDDTGDGFDNRNNVQNVYIHPDELEPGTYTVRVIGENIPEDANNDGEENQDYALVVQNAGQTEELTITVTGDGHTEPPEGTHVYPQNEKVDLSAYPSFGWEFDSWIVNQETYYDPYITITMDEDKNAYAMFALSGGPDPTSLNSIYGQYLEEGLIPEELFVAFNEADLPISEESDVEEAMLVQEENYLWNVLVNGEKKYSIVETDQELKIFYYECDSNS